jgi:hypothetical protein
LLIGSSGTGQAGAEPLPAITRAGSRNCYFESIHPFGGNGRNSGEPLRKNPWQRDWGAVDDGACPQLYLLGARALLSRLEAENKEKRKTDWLACLMV